MTGSLPRVTPCATCPYRRDVPAGIWAASEYAKLPEYDAPTGEQPVGAFACHQADGRICAGWLGYRDPTELLAVRIGTALGYLDPSCADYTTTVPLHPSGADAAAHGLAGVEDPDDAAQAAIDKLLKQRGTPR
jgi:hypothetical protein